MLADVQLELVDSLDKAQEMMRWLGERRSILGVDTETTGLVPHQDRIRLIQFGDLRAGWAIPWERWSGLALEVLARYTGDMVLHNSPFDVRFIINHSDYRWPWHRTWDTMTMAHIVDPQRPKGLKSLAAFLIDSKAIAAQRILSESMANQKWTWETVPLDFEPYWVYAALDPVLTCHLYEYFMPKITEPRLLDTEMAVLRVVTNMMLKGIRVDLEYCEQTASRLLSEAQNRRLELREQFGVHNATSGPQVSRALQEAGVTLLPKLTKGGAQAVDQEVLEAADHPIARMVLEVKHAEKTVNTYLKNLLANADRDSRVHATIWANGARTSRMTITEPALQTLTRGDGTVRNAFVPSAGNVLISIDADQIEARLAAHFSRDLGLQQAFLSPQDFFVNLARSIFQDETITKEDKRRQLTKGVVYGKLYGAGPETMAMTARVPLSQMTQAINGFDAAYPGVRRLQADVEAIARARKAEEGVGYIITPRGRRLPADDMREYALVNYLIQAHAAEIFKENLLKLDAIGLGEFLVLPVHDEILMDVPADMAGMVLETATETMVDQDSYFVPIMWSGEIIKDRWGSKYA